MHARRGFTLVEMMIVVVLIAIVTAFSMPKIDYTQMRLDSAGRSLRGALQQAQARAIAQQHNVDVGVDVNRSRLVMIDDYKADMLQDSVGEHEWAASLNDGVIFATPSLSLPGGETPIGGVAGATLTSMTYQTALIKAFVFHPDGSVSSDVQLYIKSQRGLARDWRAIYIWQATGRTDWYRMSSTGAAWTQNGF